MILRCKSFLAIVLLLFLFGCVEKNYYSETVPSETSDPVNSVVTNTPNQTLSFQDAKLLEPGTVLKLRLNRAGSVVKEYDVKFDGTYEMDGEHLIFCTTNANLVVGQGDSGSPLMTSDGKIIGALCYGFYYSNYQFAARAIEDMIAIDTSKVSQKSVQGASNLYKNLGLVQYTTGLNEKYLERYSGQYNPFNNANTVSLNNQTTNLKSAFVSSGAVIPGNSVAINLISGDLYTVGAIGTLSHVTENKKFLAFGHAFGVNTIGARATLANMVTMINSTEIAYKIAVPTNQTVGCMITDTENGILIDPQATAAEFNHQLVINMTGELATDLGEKITTNHTIANFLDPARENYYAAVIPALIVYSQIILKGHISLQATCTLSVTFKNASALSSSFSVYSTDGWLDNEIYSSLQNEIYNHFSGGIIDNITDYKITLDIADYNPITEY